MQLCRGHYLPAQAKTGRKDVNTNTSLFDPSLGFTCYQVSDMHNRGRACEAKDNLVVVGREIWLV